MTLYVSYPVIARRAMPDVAISYWTTGDPHVAALLWMTLYVSYPVIARRAMPDVAISYETAGDPHVAALLGMNCVKIQIN